MYRYFVIAYQDNGLASYGKRMTVELVDGDDDLTNGMVVNIFGMKDGCVTVPSRLSFLLPPSSCDCDDSTLNDIHPSEANASSSW